MEGFYHSKVSKEIPLQDLQVQVLTHGNWPTDKVGKEKNAPQVSMPREISFCMQQFNKYYLNKHQGRVLYWRPQLGTADLRFFLPNDVKHDITMSTYQMIIAVAFNEKTHYSYKELLESTRIPETDFKCHLIPFLSLKIISKNPPTREFLVTD